MNIKIILSTMLAVVLSSGISYNASAQCGRHHCHRARVVRYWGPHIYFAPPPPRYCAPPIAYYPRPYYAHPHYYGYAYHGHGHYGGGGYHHHYR